MINSKIESLQLLRFLAAMLIVSVHLDFEFGHIGVDIFFVLSGFIISYVTDKKTKLFFVNRLIRIIPIYWFFTLIFAFTLLVLPEVFELSKFNSVYLIKSLFFIPFNNLETGHYPLVIYGWTLNYEIFFYFIFGLAILINKKYLIQTFFLIFFLIYFLNLYLDNFISNVYSNPIIFEFIFGVIIYIIYKNVKRFNFFSLKTILIFIPLLISVIYLYNEFNELRLIAYGIPSVIILLIFLLLNKLSFPKIFVLLGDSSYCLYLLHPYIFQFSRKVLSSFNLSFEILTISILFNIILCIIISIYLHKFFELPIQMFLKKYFR